MKKINDEIGRKIRELRMESGMTQSELAEKIGRNLSSVQKYEQGDIDISITTLQNIAFALNVSLESFFNKSFSPQNVEKQLWFRAIQIDENACKYYKARYDIAAIGVEVVLMVISGKAPEEVAKEIESIPNFEGKHYMNVTYIGGDPYI